MAKVKDWNVDSSGANEELRGSDYVGPEPTRGGYRMKLVTLELKKSKSDTKHPMLNGIAVIDEPKGSANHRYNGWSSFYNFNLLPGVSAGFTNSLLVAIGANVKKVWDGDVVTSGTYSARTKPGESVPVLSLGGIKFKEGMPVNGILKQDKGDDEYEPQMKIQRFAKIKPKDEDEDEDAEEDDDDDIEEDDDDIEEDEDERTAELAEMNLADLRKEAKELEIETKGLKKDALVAAIIEAEDDDEDDEDEDDEDDDAERREELDEMGLADLKTVAKGLKVKTVGKKKPDLIEAILEAEASEPPF